MLRKPGSRRALLGAATTATLLAATGSRQAAAANGLQRLAEHPEPRPLPEGLSFTDAAGQTFGFEAFRGKALVVNFWATWCPPCVTEMPALDRLHAMVAPDGIEVLALSNDRGGRAQVEPFYRRTNLRHMAIWLDPRGATGRALQVRVLPTTILIDRGGLEVARLTGDAEWDHPEVVAAIRRLTRAHTLPTTTRS